MAATSVQMKAWAATYTKQQQMPSTAAALPVPHRALHSDHFNVTVDADGVDAAHPVEDHTVSATSLLQCSTGVKIVPSSSTAMSPAGKLSIQLHHLNLLSPLSASPPAHLHDNGYASNGSRRKSPTSLLAKDSGSHSATSVLYPGSALPAVAPLHADSATLSARTAPSEAWPHLV